MPTSLAGLTLGIAALITKRNHLNTAPAPQSSSQPDPTTHKESSQAATDRGQPGFGGPASSESEESILRGSAGKSVSETSLSARSLSESGKSRYESRGCTSLGSGSNLVLTNSDRSCVLQKDELEGSLSGLCHQESGTTGSVLNRGSCVRNGKSTPDLNRSVRVDNHRHSISESSSRDRDSSTTADHKPVQEQSPKLTMVVGDHLRPEGPPDLQVKLILLGDYSVGKSSLLRVLARQSHQLTHKERCSDSGNLSQSQSIRSRSLTSSRSSSSCGIRPMSPLWEEGKWMLVRSCLQPGEFVEVEFMHQDKRVLARVADTGGQERYRSMTTSYYRGAHGCLLMFDVTKEDSFSSLDTWIENIDRYKTMDEFPCILVGTKCKSPARRILYDRATEFAESRGLPYMELDMDHMTDIRRVFEALLDSVTVRMNKPSPIAINIRPDISDNKDVFVQKHVACSC